MRVIFWWSIFAILFFSIAWLIAYNKMNKSADDSDIMEDEMGQDMEEIVAR